MYECNKGQAKEWENLQIKCEKMTFISVYLNEKKRHRKWSNIEFIRECTNFDHK